MNKITVKLRRNWVLECGFIILTLLGVVVVTVVYLAFRDQLPLYLAIGLVLYLGFGLPRWLEFTKRKQFAYDAKKLEQIDWGFHGRDREGPWINYVQYPVVKEADCAKGKFFYSEWLVIHDGKIIVNPGVSKPDKAAWTVSYSWGHGKVYAWNGCSPKRMFFWIAIVGTPDWRCHNEAIVRLNAAGRTANETVYWPKAHHASLVHDALYQYLDQIPIPKKDVDKLFHEMLLDSQLPNFVALVYHTAVDWFGARDVKNPAVGQSNSRFHCDDPPG